VQLNRLGVGVEYKDKSNIKRWKSHQQRRCRGNSWFVPYDTIQSKSARGNHPAPFPFELASMCIRLHGVRHDDTFCVLDPFCGTGSANVAANMLFVNSIGVDLSADYLKSAEDRIRFLGSN